jgi:hypothetical protein
MIYVLRSAFVMIVPWNAVGRSCDVVGEWSRRKPEKRASLTGHSVPGLGDRSFRKVMSGDVIEDREHDRGGWSRRSAMSHECKCQASQRESSRKIRCRRSTPGLQPPGLQSIYCTPEHIPCTCSFLIAIIYSTIFHHLSRLAFRWGRNELRNADSLTECVQKYLSSLEYRQFMLRESHQAEHD